jgi:hypothetical protein
MGAKLLLSNNLPEKLFDEINKVITNTQVKEKELNKLNQNQKLPSSSTAKDFSMIFKHISDISSQMSTENIKNYILDRSTIPTVEKPQDSSENNSQKVQNQNPNLKDSLLSIEHVSYPVTKSNEAVLANDRLELCLVLQTYNEMLTKKFETQIGKITTEVEVDGKNMTLEESNLDKVVKAFKLETGDEKSHQLMVITLKVFINNFQKAIEGDNFEIVKLYVNQAIELTEMIENPSDIKKGVTD